MAVINDSSSNVTALMKYYDSDESQFWQSGASPPHQKADVFYAVTIHSSTTTNQTIIRFIQSAATRLRPELSDKKFNEELDLIISKLQL